MVIKDRIGNVLWETIPNLEQAISEKLCPLCDEAENLRGLASHPPWLVEQINATATENSAMICSNLYNRPSMALLPQSLDQADRTLLVVKVRRSLLSW